MVFERKKKVKFLLPITILIALLLPFNSCHKSEDIIAYGVNLPSYSWERVSGMSERTVFDIACLPNDELVVATDNGIYYRTPHDSAWIHTSVTDTITTLAVGSSIYIFYVLFGNWFVF